MIRGRLGLLLAVLLVHSAGGVNYVNDELLWTKQPWNQSPEYKLAFPWHHFAKREPAVAGLLESGDWVKNSLNGPLGDIQAEIDKDIKRGKDLQPSRFDVSLLDESASMDAAAGVAQCKVCMALASALWRGLTSWVNLHEAVPSKKRIGEYAAQLCEQEVPNDVLSEWVLLRAKVQPSQMAPFYIEGNQEFYMLSQRQKQHATPAEIEAVRLACTRLVHDTKVSSAKSEIAKIVTGLLHKYYDHLEQRLGKASSTGAAVEAVDDGPQVDTTCIDRHPQCEMWAKKGECAANPTYMVGDDKKYIGQCNRACGDCQRPSEPQPEWNDADIEQLTSVSQDLLAVLHSKACVSGSPCAGAAGSGMEQLLALAGGKAAEGPGKGMGFVSGPVAEKEPPMVDPQRLQLSKVITTREISETFVAHKPPKKTYATPPIKLDNPAAKTIWAQLANKCLYVPTGYWNYELCFSDSITQFHMTESNQVDWVISLGRYESSDWMLRNTTSAGLFPDGVQVPYVSQQYTNGNDCELTEDTPDDDEEEAGGAAADGAKGAVDAGERQQRQRQQQEVEDEGRPGGKGGDGKDDGGSSEAKAQQRGQQGVAGGGKAGVGGASASGVPVIKRVTELRIMCSPDAEQRVYVVEPRQCRYRVELYLPLLCLVEGFAVEGYSIPDEPIMISLKLGP